MNAVNFIFGGFYFTVLLLTGFIVLLFGFSKPYDKYSRWIYVFTGCSWIVFAQIFVLFLFMSERIVIDVDLLDSFGTSFIGGIIPGIYLLIRGLRTKIAPQ